MMSLFRGRFSLALSTAIARVVGAFAPLTRGMTLGVRVVVLDGGNRVFLVRHTYVRGWHFPGGGVDAGESLVEAAARELKEEGDIAVNGPLHLHGVFLNRQGSARDHVAVFIARDFTVLSHGKADREIAESGFFPLDALPEGTTASTKARLAEILEGKPATVEW